MDGHSDARPSLSVFVVLSRGSLDEIFGSFARLVRFAPAPPTCAGAGRGEWPTSGSCRSGQLPPTPSTPLCSTVRCSLLFRSRLQPRCSSSAVFRFTQARTRAPRKTTTGGDRPRACCPARMQFTSSLGAHHRLKSLDQVNFSGYTAVAVPAASSLSQHLAAVEHNRKVEAATAENARRLVLLEDFKSRSATALAAALDASLRPKSAALLLRLQKAHKNVAASAALMSPVYDGHAFIVTMRAARTTAAAAPAKDRSFKWHEEQYAVMLKSKLPDGCSSQDYADKCNDLFIKHLPYFKTTRLEGEHLSEAYLEFLPECMRSVAAEIEDDMREKSTFDQPDMVMERAKRRVARMADPSVEHARLACALGVQPSSPSKSTPPGVSPGQSRPGVDRGDKPEAAAERADLAMQRIEKAVAAALKARDKGDDKSNKAKKREERYSRGRLPDGKWCSSGTCQYNHDTKHPGKPCIADPRVGITISYEASQVSGCKSRLEARRAEQGKKLG
eukprot:5862044-Prymnesium_polylepis.1